MASTGTKALRIEHDITGPKIRPGGIHPQDPRYPSHGSWWRDASSGRPYVEIRLALDGDVERFRNVEGITILEGDAAIDAAVAAIQPTGPTYGITSEALLVEYIRQAGIDITDLSPEMAPQEMAKALYGKGCIGVRCTHPGKPMSCCDLRKRHEGRALEHANPRAARRIP